MRAIIGDQVAHFRFKGKNYKPGEVVVLPDSFPVRHYPFLIVRTVEPAVTRPASRAPIPPARAGRSTRR
jgi:hypothetical protein